MGCENKLYINDVWTTYNLAKSQSFTITRINAVYSACCIIQWTEQNLISTLLTGVPGCTIYYASLTTWKNEIKPIKHRLQITPNDRAELWIGDHVSGIYLANENVACAVFLMRSNNEHIFYFNTISEAI